MALRESWPAWATRLVIVKADTVAEWHRVRFRRYWTRISSTHYPGRPRLAMEIRGLIRQMAQDGWGAPRIHAELTKLGFNVSGVTVSRYLPRRPTEPDQVKRGVAFLRNHKDGIAATDLFTVPTASLRLLYGFFVIDHDRRQAFTIATSGGRLRSAGTVANVVRHETATVLVFRPLNL